ncbi:MAG: H-NS family nucleoid-associated regulatory protein [Litorivicinus sp.]
MDLSQYSDDQLAQLQTQIANELETRVQRKRDAIVSEIRDKAQAAGLSADDIIKALGGRGNKGKPVAVKYRDPANPANTWTGRGRKPKWIEAKLAGGATLESLAV